MIKMAIYIYCHLDLLEIFTLLYWPFDLISEGLTFYMALENLRAGQVPPVQPSFDAPAIRMLYVLSLEVLGLPGKEVVTCSSPNRSLGLLLRRLSLMLPAWYAAQGIDAILF